MAESLIKQERRKVANLRFVEYVAFDDNKNRPVSHPYCCMDVEASPKTIAKFKLREDLQAFLELRRNRYVSTGT